MGYITANPRYIKIGKPRVKHDAIKKTNLQKKTLPLFDFSRPLQTPKNQAPFLALIIPAMLYLSLIHI